jgi:hypothetical protein
MTARQAFLSASLGLALALGAAPESAAFDPAAHADEEVVEIVTTNEDGSLRTTKVWVVVVDGAAYVRTGNTRWGRNVERDPDVRILTAAGDHDLRVEFVTDEADREAVQQAFRAKYGWSDRLIAPFRGRSPRIMRLVERPEAE